MCREHVGHRVADIPDLPAGGYAESLERLKQCSGVGLAVLDLVAGHRHREQRFPAAGLDALELGGEEFAPAVGGHAKADAQ